MNDVGLVLEGGGLRDTFTGGILDFFMEKGIDFGRVVGVSAGACSGASYVSRQHGRNWKVHVEYPSHKDFMGWRHLLRTGNYFNNSFTFEDIPYRLVPFDETTFYDNPTEFDVVTTSRSTGRSVVFTKEDQRRFGVNKVLLASSSIPLLATPVEIDGEFHYDGGVADSIPVRYALEHHAKTVVVLTRPRGYRKTKSNALLYRLTLRKHPEFMRAVMRRSEEYNATLDFCDRMEREGRLFVFAPSPEFPVGRTERDFDRRANAYRHGHDLATREFERLQRFL